MSLPLSHLLFLPCFVLLYVKVFLQWALSQKQGPTTNQEKAPATEQKIGIFHPSASGKHKVKSLLRLHKIPL